MKRLKRGFTGCSSIQNVLNETIDGRRYDEVSECERRNEQILDLTGGKRGFTLAEVLITLAIIGVVAAISIPSVISNSQQQEFKTGLRKAVSVLNSAITMNMAIDGESPLDNNNLFAYFQRHMSIMKTSQSLPYTSCTDWSNGGTGMNCMSNGDNAVFYTTDGMRFEFNHGYEYIKLHESDVMACTGTNPFNNGGNYAGTRCEGCGSYGLNNNPDGTTKPPCVILVDVNGDRKPTPSNVNCHSASCMVENKYKVAGPNDKKLRDIFSIMITDREAVPFGSAAQKAMYGSRK